MSRTACHNGGVYLLRISLPDRPGSLGGIASALATVGADILWVEIVGRDGGVVTDDFMIDLPDGVMPDEAVSVCHAVEGVEVLWCSRYPAGSGLAMDIELLENMLEAPDQALDLIVEAAPEIFHAHWTALIADDDARAILASDMAPEFNREILANFEPLDEAHVADLPAGWAPDWMETIAAVMPISPNHTVIVGRHGGPPFERSELARLRYIASLGAMQHLRQ